GLFPREARATTQDQQISRQRNRARQDRARRIAPIVRKLVQERGLRLGRERGLKLDQERGPKLGRERGPKLGRERGRKLGRELGRERGRKLGQERGPKLDRGLRTPQPRPETNIVRQTSLILMCGLRILLLPIPVPQIPEP